MICLQGNPKVQASLREEVDVHRILQLSLCGHVVVPEHGRYVIALCKLQTTCTSWTRWTALHRGISKLHPNRCDHEPVVWYFWLLSKCYTNLQDQWGGLCLQTGSKLTPPGQRSVDMRRLGAASQMLAPFVGNALPLAQSRQYLRFSSACPSPGSFCGCSSSIGANGSFTTCPTQTTRSQTSSCAYRYYPTGLFVQTSHR